MSKHLARVACERMNLRPSLMAAQFKTNLIMDMQAFAQADADFERAEAEQRGVETLAAYGFGRDEGRGKPFLFARGIAIIPISGSLINRFGQSWGYVTGYNFIRAQLNAALADEDVLGIIFDVNSYGGECAGCFELADEIFASRASKPSLAVVDSNAYSAGYALASSASKMVVTPSGGAGSIGVVCMHVDMSKLMQNWGIDITFIFSGDHKVDGNPYEPLPEAVREQIQADVDSSRNDFVALVARNRALETKVVFDTQAQCYSAVDAMNLGLVDAVMPAGKAVTAFLAELSGSTMSQETTMSEAQKPGATAEGANTQATELSAADARKAERERISAITGCEEAAGKPALASHLALSTELSVDAAKGILAASAAESAATPVTAGAQAPNAFQAAMDASQHPNVGADADADAGTGGSDNKNMTLAQRMLADQAVATGRKVH